VVGMTRVFVPQDLAFMGLSAERLRALSPTLVPLIAHDRAGFGGGGFFMFLIGAALLGLGIQKS
jgi:dihydroorotate dehydrogenase